MKNPDAEKNNPCLREQKLSFKCFSDNGYNKDLCQTAIDNYNICKSFWVILQIHSSNFKHNCGRFLQNSVRADRRRRGVRPHLPPPEEREQIKREFFQKFLQEQK